MTEAEGTAIIIVINTAAMTITVPDVILYEAGSALTAILRRKRKERKFGLNITEATTDMTLASSNY